MIFTCSGHGTETEVHEQSLDMQKASQVNVDAELGPKLTALA